MSNKNSVIHQHWHNEKHNNFNWKDFRIIDNEKIEQKVTYLKFYILKAKKTL